MDQTNSEIHRKSLAQRILNFPVLKIFIGVVLVNVPVFIVRSLAAFILSEAGASSALSVLIIFLVRMLTVYYGYVLFVLLFEHRKADEISPGRAFPDLFTGGGLGLALILAVMGLMWITGHFSIAGVDPSATFFESVIYHTFFAFLQDVVYFVILFRIAEAHAGSWTAIVLASVIFGFKHLLFPGYTVWSAVAQACEAGLLFSALFMLTRKIWTIFGFHAVWNIIEYGLVLGFEGQNLKGVFVVHFTGSPLITGQPVGPEASIFTLLLGTALGIRLLIQAHRKGCFIRPARKSKMKD
jgi:membrane protease YdiL (CAAX protease family)